MARKVLIVQTAFLGDLLLTIPLIKRIKSVFPGCEVDLVCRSGFGDFFKTQKLVDRAYEINKGEAESYRQVLKQIRETSYDICFCPHQSFRTALFISRVQAKEKVGFKKWWNILFFSSRVTRDMSLPDALRQASLLQKWDEELKSKLDFYKESKEKLHEIPPEFSMEVEIKSIVPKFELATRLVDTKFILLASGSQWPTKRWTESGFNELAKNFKEQGLEVALVGHGKEDCEINSRIAAAVPGVLDLSDQTDLNELAYLMTKANALICNDSGLMHLASVADLPTIAIFGPTTLALGYRPWQNRARVVEKELFCRPCGRHGHKRCPLNTHECMKAINSSMVFNEFKHL